MRRVSVVGPSGSGKSTLGRALAERLGVRFVELDAIHHLAGWTAIEPDEFRRTVDEITAGEGWVIDGNYGEVVRDGIVWHRADTVVWLDLRRRDVMRQVVGRSIGRVVHREVLWNGNRERWSNLFRWDPDQSIIRWSWTTYDKVREQYEQRFDADRDGHLAWVRLCSRREVEAWLTALDRRR